MVQRVSSNKAQSVSDSAVTYSAATRPTRKPAEPAGDTTPANSSPLGALVRFGGPYALPITELAVGAWFALAQTRHVVDVISPGPAQLWRAGGNGGVIWHALAALVGAGAAVHGVFSLVKLFRKK